MNYPDRFLTASEPCHLIFGLAPGGEPAPVCVVPWADDNNRGLPDWYFGLRPDGLYSQVCFDSVQLRDGQLEWSPACGPAPCWAALGCEFASAEEVLAALSAWMRENY